MSRPCENDRICQAADLLTRAQYTVAFTGAGISTESGIPDFRSPESGLWNNIDSMKVASFYGFRHHPEEFFEWVRPILKTISHSQPNAAHLTLQELQNRGKLQAIITQNIDGLHQQAGSQPIFELHGHIRQATCIHCFRTYDTAPLIEQIITKKEIPYCPKCHHLLKPDVILFGEQLPIRPLLKAKEAARRCDLMLIVGSSLEVAPASSLPTLAKNTGARIIIINLQPTYLDSVADIVIHDRAAEVLPAILREMEINV